MIEPLRITDQLATLLKDDKQNMRGDDSTPNTPQSTPLVTPFDDCGYASDVESVSRQHNIVDDDDYDDEKEEELYRLALERHEKAVSELSGLFSRGAIEFRIPRPVKRKRCTNIKKDTTDSSTIRTHNKKTENDNINNNNNKCTQTGNEKAEVDPRYVHFYPKDNANDCNFRDCCNKRVYRLFCRKHYLEHQKTLEKLEEISNPVVYRCNAYDKKSFWSEKDYRFEDISIACRNHVVYKKLGLCRRHRCV